MTSAKDIAIGAVILVFSIAFSVFTWQHNVTAMVLDFVALIALQFAKD